MQKCTATAQMTTLVGTVIPVNHLKTSSLYVGAGVAGVSLRGRAAGKLGPLHLLGLDPLQGAHLPGLAHQAPPRVSPDLGGRDGSRQAGPLGGPGGAGFLMGGRDWLSGGCGWDHGRFGGGELL